MKGENEKMNEKEVMASSHEDVIEEKSRENNRKIPKNRIRHARII